MSSNLFNKWLFVLNQIFRPLLEWSHLFFILFSDINSDLFMVINIDLNLISGLYFQDKLILNLFEIESCLFMFSSLLLQSWLKIWYDSFVVISLIFKLVHLGLYIFFVLFKSLNVHKYGLMSLSLFKQLLLGTLELCHLNFIWLFILFQFLYFFMKCLLILLEQLPLLLKLSSSALKLTDHVPIRRLILLKRFHLKNHLFLLLDKLLPPFLKFSHFSFKFAHLIAIRSLMLPECLYLRLKFLLFLGHNIFSEAELNGLSSSFVFILSEDLNLLK